MKTIVPLILIALFAFAGSTLARRSNHEREEFFHELALVHTWSKHTDPAARVMAAKEYLRTDKGRMTIEAIRLREMARDVIARDSVSP